MQYKSFRNVKFLFTWALRRVLRSEPFFGNYAGDQCSLKWRTALVVPRTSNLWNGHSQLRIFTRVFQLSLIILVLFVTSLESTFLLCGSFWKNSLSESYPGFNIRRMDTEHFRCKNNLDLTSSALSVFYLPNIFQLNRTQRTSNFHQ